MIKNYFTIMTFSVVTIFLFCFALPWLISSENTELVLAGVALVLVAYIPAAYIIAKHYIKLFTMKGNEENEEN